MNNTDISFGREINGQKKATEKLINRIFIEGWGKKRNFPKLDEMSAHTVLGEM